ncbi:MAG: tRNA (guanosine(46)-N7)-methyltransferase TrmB [Thiotrichaceae bacterium]|nr:tRNA (guanosine(46)-N7)-methyltransferase TrmB [Thiotrichaceae bacterium]
MVDELVIETSDKTAVEHPRNIKSYVVRSGRMTPGQEKSYTELWQIYGIEADKQLVDFTQVYARQSPIILEIGFGMGDSLIEMAANNPGFNYLGIEVHKPGVGRLLGNIGERSLTNLRVMRADAVEVLKSQIPDESLQAVYLFFPDPWHKRRHNKRRIVKEEFIQLLRKKLHSHGQFHMATDWKDYAVQMLKEMNAAAGFKNCSEQGDYIPRPEYRPMTKFERRGERLGHGVWDLLFEKIA